MGEPESIPFDQIAALHASAVRDSGLSHCGTAFIEAFYREAARLPGSVLLSRTSPEGCLTGFILCSTQCRTLFRDAIRRLGLPLFKYPRGLAFLTTRRFARLLRGPQPVTYDCEIVFVAVKEECRGQGQGRGLVQEALAELHRRGAKKVFLQVNRANAPAIGCYTGLGFKAVAKWGVRMIMLKEIAA